MTELTNGATSTVSVEPPPSRGQVTVPVKLAYGAGQLVEAVSTTLINNFLFFLFTALLGLPGSLVGLALIISLVADAVADPLLGSWSDNTRSRWGRRIPFMIVGAPVVALSLGLLFSPPRGLSTWALFGWLLSLSLVLRFAVSVFNVPYTALGAEISEDYAERASVVAYRWVFAVLGGLATMMLALRVFLPAPEGLRHLAGYAPSAWATAVMILIGGAVSVLGIRRFAAGLPVTPIDTSALYRRFVGEVIEIFRNPSFRALFACSVLFYAAQGVAASLTSHMHLFVWRMSTAQISLTTLSLYVGFLAGVPIAPILSRWVEKRTVCVAGLVILCVAQGGLSGLRALGWINLTGAAAVAPLAINSFVAGIGVTFAAIAIGAMMADAADEHDFLFGKRREGLYFAGLGFAGKAATGLGALVAGVALDLIRFPAHAAEQASAPPIPAGTLSALCFVAGPLVAIVSAIATLMLMFYRIDRKRHEDVVALLKVRRVAL